MHGAAIWYALYFSQSTAESKFGSFFLLYIHLLESHNFFFEEIKIHALLGRSTFDKILHVKPKSIPIFKCEIISLVGRTAIIFVWDEKCQKLLCVKYSNVMFQLQKSYTSLIIIYLFYLDKEVVLNGSKRKEYFQRFLLYVFVIFDFVHLNVLKM